MFTIITVNVNGLRDPNKSMSFLQWLSHLSADVVCLQECHVLSCAEVDSWFSPYGCLALSSPGSVHSCGSVILYRSTFTLVKSSLGDICESWSDFYKSLFTACTVDLVAQSALLSNVSSSLTAEQAALCEGHLVPDEVRAALLGMARNKTPGSDGLPMEFYLTFWDVLGSDLVEVFNASFDAGRMSSSQRSALISLLFKKGDRLLHKNWHPIGLLNVDYKLCARALAGRLLKVLHFVVHPDQTCGVRGRYFGKNVSLLRDIAAFVNQEDLSAAVLSLDQEKAFHCVDWGFLRSTLVHMGFGRSFVSWVDLLYHGICSNVLVNGYMSAPFWPSRGVWQGCPLSPLLYVISIEVLAANLHAHPDIVGLRLPQSSDPLPALSL